MPRQTDHQLLTEVLLKAFVSALISEGNMEARALLMDNNDSDSSSSDSSDEDLCALIQPASNILMQTVSTLHSTRYLNDRITTKSLPTTYSYSGSL